jgi:succinyl-diaminopimelate desuccinylase
MNPPHCTDENSEFVKTLLNSYEAVTGLKGQCMAIGGGTYVHHIEGGVAFGCAMPGIDYRIHGANEFMPVNDLINSAKIFALAILRLCC